MMEGEGEGGGIHDGGRGGGRFWNKENSYHECDASEAEKECVNPQVAIANQMRHFLCMHGSSVPIPSSLPYLF